MKNNLTLEQVYLKSKGLIKEQAENEFVSEVDLSVYPSGGSNVDIENPKKIMVKYTIDVDYRSYGIKGITAHLIGASPFSFDIVTYDDNDDPIREPVNVDLSRLDDNQKKVNLDIGKYGQVFPYELEVHLNEDYTAYELILNF